MTEIDGGTIVAKALKAENIKCVFTLPSGEILPILEKLVEEGVQVITTRHEQAAGNAADGWARVTRSPGVCIVPTGPGLANLIPAITQAFYAGSPVVAISGHSAYKYTNMNAFEEINGVEIVSSITKWAKQCTFTGRLHEFVQEAFRHATCGKMGPVLLEIPKDILQGKCDAKRVKILPPEQYRSKGRIHGDPALVKKAVDFLLASEKPLIIAGSGVYWSGAWEELIKLAELLSIPVACEGLAVGCVPYDHPLYVGNAIGNPFMRNADVLLVIGAKFDEFLGFGRDLSFYSEDVKVIKIDIDPSEIGKNRPVDVGILGDAKAVLTQMLEFLSKSVSSAPKERGWSKEVRSAWLKFNESFERAAESSEKPIRPQRLMKEIRELVGKDTICVLDGGDTTAWAYLYLRAYRPGQIIGSQGPFGHLGAGIPMGIAAKLAYPNGKVFVITGDGSFLFNGSELDTAVRYNIPIIVIVANDSAWGMVYHTRSITSRSKEKAALFTFLNEKVRYDKYAESLGAYGELVTEPNEIKPAIKRAIRSNLPAVVDVRVSREFATPLSYILTAKREI
ncbi:MAG: thiamine pyrophosphate-binding protein [Candidatus Baldrarchaeia archaeon]